MTTNLARSDRDQIRRRIRRRLAGCRFELEEAIIEAPAVGDCEKLRHHLALALLEVEGAIQADQDS